MLSAGSSLQYQLVRIRAVKLEKVDKEIQFRSWLSPFGLNSKLRDALAVLLYFAQLQVGSFLTNGLKGSVLFEFPTIHSVGPPPPSPNFAEAIVFKCSQEGCIFSRAITSANLGQQTECIIGDSKTVSGQEALLIQIVSNS